MLRLALIGTGRAARARARDLQTAAEARLAVIASADPIRANSLAAEYGVGAASDLTAAIQRPDIDAILVCTYNERHADLVRAGLRAGKHVCVEYPLALSEQEGQELLQLAGDCGRVLHVEHIDLLSPWFQTVLAHLPELGTVRSLLWQDISARQPQPRDWTFEERSGFSLFAGASVLSRLVRIGGAVIHADAAEILAERTSEGSFQRRLTSAHLRFENGVTALISDGTGFAAAGPASSLTIVGDHGILQAEQRRRVTLTTADGPRELTVPGGGIGLFAQDLADFCGQILRGDPSYVPAGHVRRVLAAAGKARDSLTPLPQQ